MAKKDAIFNYSAAFDTSGYLTGLQADWDNNQASGAHNDRFDIMWSGDPTATPGTPIAGWEEGKVRALSTYAVALDSSLAPNEEGFQSTTHKLIYNIKRAFNLPNQENLATWKDEYSCAAGEHHLFQFVDKDMASWPMTLSQAGFELDGENPTKCALEIGISGMDQHGGATNDMQYTVRPTSTNVTAYNNHYAGLVSGSTAAADYTNPPQVGTEFSQIGNVLLVNYENHWQPTDLVSNDRDQLKFILTWSSHSYAQIKALIDAAIA